MTHEILLILDSVMLVFSFYVGYESIREKEQRASIISALGIGFHVALLYITLYLPSLFYGVYLYYTILAGGLVFF